MENNQFRYLYIRLFISSSICQSVCFLYKYYLAPSIVKYLPGTQSATPTGYIVIKINCVISAYILTLIRDNVIYRYGKHTSHIPLFYDLCDIQATFV
jgi:hypothetical protein